MQNYQQITKSLVLVLLTTLFSVYVSAKPTVIKLNKNEEGYYWLNVTINQKSAQFIIDTGASGSVIDSSKLASFNLTKNDKPFNGTAFGDESSSQVQTDTLEVSQFAISGISTSVNTIYTHSLEQLSEGMSGIIGQDVLVDLNAKLEVANGLLIIPAKNEVESKVSANTEIPIQKSSMGFHYISATLGTSPINLILDTGAPQMVLDEQTLTKMGFESTLHPTAKTIDAQGKELPIRILTPTVLKVGKSSILPKVMLTDMSGLINAMKQSDAPLIVGVLGNAEMAELGATIEFKHQKLLLKSEK